MKVELLFIVFLLIVGCQTNDKTRLENKDSGFKKNDSVLVGKSDSLKANKPKEELTFLDSILRKYELSVNQIRTNTLIDSVYYTDMNANAVFTGETVFDFNNGYKGAIIDYSDRRVCSYKFLLVFKTSNNQNTDNKLIYTDCDRDESSGYRFVRYKFLSNAVFETVETYMPANSGDDSSHNSIEKIKWRVSKNGLIDSIPNI